MSTDLCTDMKDFQSIVRVGEPCEEHCVSVLPVVGRNMPVLI